MAWSAATPDEGDEADGGPIGQRRRYETPSVVDLGTVAELTLGSLGPGPDSTQLGSH